MTVRDTPVTFAPDDAERMRVTASEHGMAECPRCDRRLLIGPAAVGSGGFVREWRCPECARCAMLSDQ